MLFKDIKDLKENSYHKIQWYGKPNDIVITKFSYRNKTTYYLSDIILLSGNTIDKGYSITSKDKDYVILEPDINLDKFKKENPEYFI